MYAGAHLSKNDKASACVFSSTLSFCVSFEMSPEALVLLLLVACGLSGELCECFPNGSLALSCGDMMPYHPPFSPSTDSPPFILTTSSATFRPGGTITGSSFRSTVPADALKKAVQESAPCLCVLWSPHSDAGGVGRRLYRVSGLHAAGQEHGRKRWNALLFDWEETTTRITTIIWI